MGLEPVKFTSYSSTIWLLLVSSPPPAKPLHGTTTRWPWWGWDCPFIINYQSGSPWQLG